MNPGDILTSHYRILKSLGKGGMGEVYLAEDKGLYGNVVVKIPHFGNNEQIIKRFAREIRILSKINHHHIVKILYSDLSNDQPFYVMEYCERGSIINNIPFGSLDKVLFLFKQVLEALQFAHQYGIIHRDLKPDNILINSQGVVKVSDFGLAKLMDRDSPTLTKSNMILGTPHYMAPEQFQRPKSVDERSDIYSFGVIFSEIITGKNPFEKDRTKSLKSTFQSITQHENFIINDIINKATAYDLADRYKNINELKDAVERIQFDNSNEKEGWIGRSALKKSELRTELEKINRDEFYVLQAVLLGKIKEVSAIISIEIDSEPLEDRGFDIVKNLIKRDLLSGQWDGHGLGGYLNLVPTSKGMKVYDALMGIKNNAHDIFNI